MDNKELDEIKEDKTTERYQVKAATHCGPRDHYFKYISGTEAECNKCHTVGFPISPGTVVRDGHIYIEEQLVI